MIRQCIAPALALAVILPAHAAPKPPAPAKAPAPLAYHGAMGILVHHMAGQPVMCVGNALGDYKAKIDPATLAKAATLTDKVKAIASAASNEHEKVLPLAVGNGWVLAPEKREEVDPTLKPTLPNVMGSTARLNVLLADFTPDQRPALGTEDGLPVSDLSPEAQALLESVVRPPLRITTGMQGGKDTRIEAPVDWKSARIRARLRMDGAWIAIRKDSWQVFSGRDRDVPGLWPDGLEQDAQGVSLPFLHEVANGFRPSDLEGKGFEQPIGVQGVMPVSDALKRLSAVTGLRLASAKVFQSVPVFIGSKDMTAGAVLDGLRLGTTGAFRKLGDTYILAWDRWGFGGLQQFMYESRDLPIAKTAREKIDAALESSNLAMMARDLPFMSDDPLALTKDQQARLFDTSNNPAFIAPRRTFDTLEEAKSAPPDPRRLSIPFLEMTREQRLYLIKAAATTKVYDAASDKADDIDWNGRPITDAELHSAMLTNNVNILLSVFIPGHGWVSLSDMGFGYGTFMGSDHPAPGRTEQDDFPQANAGAPPPAPPVTPVAIPARKRGVVLPILGPGRVTSLAKDLKRRGFNVVFYPALDGGYATFENPAFPKAAVLGEWDGLKSAIGAMKEQGINVVPYVSVLGWQRPGDTPHWLDKHPGWLDVDILGRPRLDYAGYHPMYLQEPGRAVLAGLNFVRPDEPEVRAKLDALLAALAKEPGVTDVAFMDWKPPAGSRRGVSPGEPVASMPDEPPPLGYSVPARIAAFAATGADPVDRPMNPKSPDQPFWPKIFLQLGRNATADKNPPPDPPDASAALLNALLSEAKSAWPAGTFYVLDAPPGAGTNLRVLRDVRADLAIPQAVPLWPAGTLIPGMPPAFQPLPSIAIATMRLTATKAVPPSLPPLVVLDFRAIPSEIEDALKWIAGPGGP